MQSLAKHPAAVVNEPMTNHFCWWEIKNHSAYRIVYGFGCFLSNSLFLSFILLVSLYIQRVGSKWVHMCQACWVVRSCSSFLSTSSLNTQGGFSVGHQISRKPPPGDVVGVLLSIFFFFLKLSLYNVSLGIIPTKLWYIWGKWFFMVRKLFYFKTWWRVRYPHRVGA